MVADADYVRPCAGVLVNLGSWYSPEWFEVMIDLVEEIFDYYCIVPSCEGHPRVKCGRRMSTATISIGCRRLSKGGRSIRQEVFKVLVRIRYQLVNGMLCWSYLCLQILIMAPGSA